MLHLVSQTKETIESKNVLSLAEREKAKACLISGEYVILSQ